MTPVYWMLTAYTLNTVAMKMFNVIYKFATRVKVVSLLLRFAVFFHIISTCDDVVFIYTRSTF